MMLAQRYPNDYDGIIAAAPAKDWAEILISSLWGSFYMETSGNVPYGCELDELTRLAISCCDELDGVKDGIISYTEECKSRFNPLEHVGSTFNCLDTGKMIKISQAAADVATALYQGPKTSKGEFIWYGFEVGTDLKTLAPTTCTKDNCNATGAGGAAQVYKYFMDKNPVSNRTKLTYEEFDWLVLSLKEIFSSDVEANVTDLEAFKSAGGKMLTYHGLVSFLFASLYPRFSTLTSW